MSLKTTSSAHSVAGTVERLRAALERRGIAVLGEVDHGAGARDAGLELADEQVVIFGDARTGTPLMQEDPEIGYELPLRLLVWDAGGQTLIGYRPPTALADQYSVPEHAEVLARMERLLGQLASESAAED